MLECGKNMKGTIAEICSDCNVLDDENHRLNFCTKWADKNNVHGKDVDFGDVYTNDKEALNRVIERIEKVWELKYGNGKMKK